ncbi:MAG: succinyl-diaminopimelate desuccinylase [Acidimicrobiia bacterium]
MATNPFLTLNPQDTLEVLKALIATESYSHNEDTLCSFLQQWIPQIRPDAHLTRISNTLVVQVNTDADSPVILAGHIDTVPSAHFNGELNDRPIQEGDLLYGLGAADMKSGVAVMISLLKTIKVNATFIFYEAEEVAEKFNGLLLVLNEKPELMRGKWAILLEPTNGQLEMGCQGAITVKASFHGKRAHSARPWMGENAIHKSLKVQENVQKELQSQQEVEIEGLTYSPTLQITKASGGVAANVIPDLFELTINHRFTPDIKPDQATAYINQICDGADSIEVVSIAGGAVPAVDHPLVAFAKSRGRKLVPKVAWTDVARFYNLNIPAVNCGPGDATLCHTPGEHIEISKLQDTYDFLNEFIANL